jgi:hypothetical protein
MARGLIDFPIKSPVVFDLVTGHAPWDIWDICCLFADQYNRIFGGISTDLWIERLTYYPAERLIHPWIGT